MSDLPTIGSAAQLAEHRKRTNAPLLRARIADKLRTIAGHVARDNVKTGSPTAAFVVLLTPDAPPLVTWAGDVDWDDLRTASHAMHDANMASYQSTWREQRSIEDHVTEGWEGRRRHAARRVEKAAQLADEKPWQCEHCDRRFRTERGARQHERRCRWPRRQFEPAAGFSLAVAQAPGSDPLPDD